MSNWKLLHNGPYRRALGGSKQRYTDNEGRLLTTCKVTDSGYLEELVVLLHLTGLAMLGHLRVQMAEVHGLGLARRHRSGDV